MDVVRCTYCRRAREGDDAQCRGCGQIYAGAETATVPKVFCKDCRFSLEWGTTKCRNPLVTGVDPVTGRGYLEDARDMRASGGPCGVGGAHFSTRLSYPPPPELPELPPIRVSSYRIHLLFGMALVALSAFIIAMAFFHR